MAQYSLSEYESMAQDCLERGESAHWLLGDLMIALTADYGDKAVNTIANLLRVSPGTLRKKRLTAERFTGAQREIGLPWSMYETVSHVTDPARREKLLASAADGNWTTDQLRHEARGHLTPPPLDVDKFVTRTITALLRIAEEQTEATMLMVLRQLIEGTGANLEGLEG